MSALCGGAGPVLARSRGVNDHGRLAIHATDPDIDVLIDIGEHIVVTERSGSSRPHARRAGRRARRCPQHSRPVGEPVAAEVAWMLDGLATTFDNG